MAGNKESTTLLKEKRKGPSKKLLDLIKQAGVPTDGTCLYCQTDNSDELKVGRLLHDTVSGITVHHYCLLFASGLSQRGKEHQGIEGFLPEDIIQEFRRAKRLACRYCTCKGATIGCVIKRCPLTFHFPCGLANGTLSQFFGNFNSFCFEHRPNQEADTTHGSPSKAVCPICFCDVPSEIQVNVLRTPCCKNLWLHRECLQRQAISSGYFFRCPVCNNKDEFEEEMRKFGIYIPEQDASWEREDGAFQDLLERHQRCDAEDCLCPDGRTFSKGKKWLIMLCDLCGSQGCHVKCGGLKNGDEDWACWICRTMVCSDIDSKKVKSTTKKAKKSISEPMQKMNLQGKTVRTPLATNKLMKDSIPAVRYSITEGLTVARTAAGVSLPDVAVEPLSWKEIEDHGCVDQLYNFSQHRKSSRLSCKLEIPPMIYKELDELIFRKKRALEDSDSDTPPVINKMAKRLRLELPCPESDQQILQCTGEFIQTSFLTDIKFNKLSDDYQNSSGLGSSSCCEPNSPPVNDVIIISSDDEESSPDSISNVSTLLSVSGSKFGKDHLEIRKSISGMKCEIHDLADDTNSKILKHANSQLKIPNCDFNGSVTKTKSKRFFDDFNSCDIEVDNKHTINFRGVKADILQKNDVVHKNSTRMKDKISKKNNEPPLKFIRKQRKLRKNLINKNAKKTDRLFQPTLNRYFISSSSSGVESPIRSSPRFERPNIRITRNGLPHARGGKTTDVLKQNSKKKLKKNNNTGNNALRISNEKGGRPIMVPTNKKGNNTIKFSNKKKNSNELKYKGKTTNFPVTSSKKRGRPKKVKRRKNFNDALKLCNENKLSINKMDGEKNDNKCRNKGGRPKKLKIDRNIYPVTLGEYLEKSLNNYILASKECLPKLSPTITCGTLNADKEIENQKLTSVCPKNHNYQNNSPRDKPVFTGESSSTEENDSDIEIIDFTMSAQQNNGGKRNDHLVSTGQSSNQDDSDSDVEIIELKTFTKQNSFDGGESSNHLVSTGERSNAEENDSDVEIIDVKTLSGNVKSSPEAQETPEKQLGTQRSQFSSSRRRSKQCVCTPSPLSSCPRSRHSLSTSNHSAPSYPRSFTSNTVRCLRRQLKMEDLEID